MSSNKQINKCRLLILILKNKIVFLLPFSIILHTLIKNLILLATLKSKPREKIRFWSNEQMVHFKKTFHYYQEMKKSVGLLPTLLLHSNLTYQKTLFLSSLSPSVPLSLSLTLPHSLFPSLSHSLTHSLSLTLHHSHTHSLSLLLTYSLTLSLLSYFLSLSHSLSLTLTHSLFLPIFTSLPQCLISLFFVPVINTFLSRMFTRHSWGFDINPFKYKKV